MGRARLIVVFAVAVTQCACAGGAATENGLTTKPPAQIVAAARTAGMDAATVHVAGSILGAPTPISLDMELFAGKGGQGHVVLDGLPLGLVNVDNSLYIKGSEAFYARILGADAARRLQGRWLKGSSHGAAFGALATLTSLRAFIGQVLTVRGPLTRAPATKVLGQTAIAVRDGALGGTLYVASRGTPYPLAIVERGARHGTLVFSRWNQPVSLEPPADAINIKQLQKR